MSNPKMIKTICGIDKYHQLRRDRSLWGKFRLTWFVVIATLRDLNKQSDLKSEQKREEINLNVCNDLFDFKELGNSEFIQLLWDQEGRLIY